MATARSLVRTPKRHSAGAEQKGTLDGAARRVDAVRGMAPASADAKAECSVFPLELIRRRIYEAAAVAVNKLAASPHAAAASSVLAEAKTMLSELDSRPAERCYFTVESFNRRKNEIMQPILSGPVRAAVTSFFETFNKTVFNAKDFNREALVAHLHGQEVRVKILMKSLGLNENQDTTNLQRSVEEKDGAMRKMQTSLKTSEAELQALREELRIAQESTRHLQTQLEGCITKDSAEANVRFISTQLEGVQQENKKMAEFIRSVRQDLQLSEAIASSNSAQYSQVQEVIRTRQQELTKLQAEMLKLQQINSDLQIKLGQTEAQLNERLVVQADRLKSAAETLKHAELERDQLCGELRAVSSKLKTSESKYEHLEQKLHETTETAAASAKKAEADYAQLQQQLVSERQAKVAAGEDGEKLAADNAQLQISNSQLKTDLQQVSGERDSLRTQVAELKQAGEGASHAASTAQSQYQTDISERDQLIQKLQTELAVARAELMAKDTAASEREQKISVLSSDVAAKSQQLVDSKQSAQTMQAEMVVQADRLKSAAEALKLAELERDQLRGELSGTTVKLQASESQVSGLRQELSGVRDDAAAAAKKSTAELAQLQQTLAAETAAKTAAEDSSKKLAKDNAQLQTQLTSEQADKIAAEEKFKKAQAENTDLTQNNIRLDVSLREMTSERAKLSVQISEMQNAAAKAAAAAAEEKAQMQKAFDELQKARAQLEARLSTISINPNSMFAAPKMMAPLVAAGPHQTRGMTGMTMRPSVGLVPVAQPQHQTHMTGGASLTASIKSASSTVDEKVRFRSWLGEERAAKVLDLALECFKESESSNNSQLSNFLRRIVLYTIYAKHVPSAEVWNVCLKSEWDAMAVAHTNYRGIEKVNTLIANMGKVTRIEPTPNYSDAEITAIYNLLHPDKAHCLAGILSTRIARDSSARNAFIGKIRADIRTNFPAASAHASVSAVAAREPARRV